MMQEETMKSITTGIIWDRAYSLDNYSVYDVNRDGSTCAIYFSSSSIYYPNTNEALRERILEQDYYEWKNYLIERASRHIFIRDVAKQFYIYGINRYFPTIDDTIKLLKELTKGYEILTVGSSAGGYMASLVGALLNAKVVYCFSSFFSLSHVNQEVWYLLKKEKDNNLYNQYYEIAQFMESAKNTTFFCVMPGLSRDRINNDYEQCNFVEDLPNVYTLKIKEKEHGVCMYPYLLKEYLNIDIEKIKRISENERGNLVSKWKISVYIIGIKKSVLCYTKYVLEKIVTFIIHILKDKLLV